MEGTHTKRVRDFITPCHICQQFKSEHLRSKGLLSPLPIPVQIWEDISLDFVDRLPSSEGKTKVLVVMDRLSKYSHFIAIKHSYTATQVAQIVSSNVFKLHGLPRTMVCDRDPIFVSKYWKELFRLQGTSFNFSSSYHPQTDGPTEVTNHSLEMYLRCLASDNQKEWNRWPPWAEYCYNTSLHSSIKTTPFQAVYGWEPPHLLSYVPSTAEIKDVADMLEQRDLMLKLIKYHLHQAQQRMETNTDWYWQELEFQIGDKVCMRLQNYRQHTVLGCKPNKFAPRYVGPYSITHKISSVTYHVDLPAEARIHNVLHISMLKPAVRTQDKADSTFSALLTENGLLPVWPQAVLAKENRGQHQIFQIQWMGGSTAQGSWKSEKSLRKQFPSFLEDKEISKRGAMLRVVLQEGEGGIKMGRLG